MTQEECTAQYGPTWTTQQLTDEFEVIGFCYYMCVAKRKKDGVKGTLDFKNFETQPYRLYFGFTPEN